MTRHQIRTLTFSMGLIACNLAVASTTPSRDTPHLDLEMTGTEYRDLFTRNPHLYESLLTTPRSTQLKPLLALGQRNLAWIDAINSTRPADQHLDLWTPDNTVGIPIDRPNKSSPKIIQAAFADFKRSAPSDWLEVWLGSGALPSYLAPERDEEFLKYSRQLDRVYQSASRWLLEEPYLADYAASASEDVRGYYFLNQAKDLPGFLATYASLPEAKQNDVHLWLLTLCYNSNRAFDSCRKDLAAAEPHAAHGALGQYAKKYWKAAKAKYEAFFKIAVKRPDITWTEKGKDKTHAHVPFLMPDGPTGEAVHAYLRDNIEDEWRQSPFWSLTLDFAANAPEMSRIPHIVFEEGVTPHVNALAGNEITMDANLPIETYSSRWTIRHEFGHVLGYPDCYVEFYDATEQVMVNYQLDTADLMCSRRGQLQPSHVKEFKRVYGK